MIAPGRVFVSNRTCTLVNAEFAVFAHCVHSEPVQVDFAWLRSVVVGCVRHWTAARFVVGVFFRT